jgi:uncharacterized protein (DUF427 family)
VRSVRGSGPVKLTVVTESVWDYPRPPTVEREHRRITVTFGGSVICDTTAAWRVLETSHPPTYYLPVAHFAAGSLRLGEGSSFCEWKGWARYLDICAGDLRATGAAWTYPRPNTAFAVLVDHVALYCAAVDRCTVGGEVVAPQPGGFYGGWVTSWVTGPFKGGSGTAGW